jgi:hypothetical protein
MISPAFLEADLTNPAVLKLINSEDERRLTGAFFAELEKFNNRSTDDGTKRPSDFYTIDGSQPGLTVTLFHELKPRANEVHIIGTSTSPRLQQYRYDTKITVKPSATGLIAFFFIQSSLILLAIFIFKYKQADAKLMFEERVLMDYFSGQAIEGNPDSWRGHVLVVSQLLSNFHSFRLQLDRRYNNRSKFQIKDEYDVQDLLHALLKLHFRDVRDEEYTPSYAGGASRMDFLLAGTGIVIEAKMARAGHADSAIGAELLVDVARYSAHPQCDHLICFVYDPENKIVNASAIQNDMATHPGNFKVTVIFSPMH